MVMLWLALSSAGAAADGPSLVVVVNPARTDHVDVHTLARIYLRTRRFWDDGTPIVPLNLEAGSREREAFTRRVPRKKMSMPRH